MRASNAGTWFTAHRVNSYFSSKRRTRSMSSVWRTIACAISALVSLAPVSISHTASGLSCSRCVARSRAYAFRALGGAPLRVRDLGAGEPGARLDLPHGLGLELLAVRREEPSVRDP